VTASDRREPTSLAEGLSFEQVRQRHLRYANALLGDGVTFPYQRATERPDLLELVRAHVPGAQAFTPDENTAAVLAVDADSTLIAGVAVVFMRFANAPLAAHVWQLAVTPNWRRRGLGTVLLTMLPRLAGAHGLDTPTITFGACDVPLADFYQQAGFTVLAPGVPLPVPLAGRALIANTNRHHPCWMYRSW
jgi:GNAT superfamily N-acetyltransferase